MRIFPKSDHFFKGILVGLLSSTVLYFIILIIMGSLTQIPYWLQNPKTPYLLALIPNLLIFRYLMVNKKQDKTGRGVLLVVFLVIFAVFIFVK